MVIQNSINLTATGIVSHDGSGVFAGRTITGTTDFIDVSNGNGVSGSPVVSIGTNFEQSGMHAWNGTFVEKANSTIASDGATITLSLERSGGGDLTIIFSDGYYAYDTTPADTVTLTAGTDTSPTTNYVYVLQSSKTLTASTSGFPATECARVATVVCQSAATIQTKGVYKHHQWTDDVNEANEQGHTTDISLWIRNQNATYLTGINQTFTITTNAGSADNVILTTTSGEILQLHSNSFPAFSGTPDVYVINDSSTPYNIVTDLNSLLTDSTGASMSGRYFSLVIWGAVNQNTGDCKLFCNLPSGSYNNSVNLVNDISSFANYTIPSDYKGVGFLIAQWDLRHQTASNGTWTSEQEIDLRGQMPALGAGGSLSFPTEFSDDSFLIEDNLDVTKKLAFQCSGITTANTRTLTVPDVSGTIALTAASSTDNALARWSDATGNTIQNSTVIVSDNGEMTNGSQPAFLATLSSAQNNVTGDGTQVTVVYGTEIFDQNADFNNATGVFTAPVTGRYQFNCVVNVSNIGGANTSGNFKFVASNREVQFSGLDYGAIDNVGNTVRIAGSMVIDMDAADTCEVAVTISGGTLIVDITTDENAFSGFLVC